MENNYDFSVELSLQEKLKCLKEILNKINKILYVYDKSLCENSQYNHKVFCGGILWYVSSSNKLFEGDLISVVVNLNYIIDHDLDKAQLKRLVFESKNELERKIDFYRSKIREEKSSKTKED